MTSTLLQTAPSLTVPPTQNTAPVLEFGCLYTHDIRRKAKRWQDGFLRYHTFNKRIMVYDVPGNFVGDFHWQQDEDLQEGDEVTLENCILVQVSEERGRTETDLSVLLQKRGNSSPAKDQMAGQPVTVRSSNVDVHSQMQPKSLNAVLGTPMGRYGRTTLADKSPFDCRESEGAGEWQNGPKPKRQKTTTDTPPRPWAVVKTSKVTKSAYKDEAPLWARTADARLKRPAPNSIKATGIAKTPSQARLAVKEVIDLSSDIEERFQKWVTEDLQFRNEKASEQCRPTTRKGRSKSPSRALHVNPKDNPKIEHGAEEAATLPLRKQDINAPISTSAINSPCPAKAKTAIQERLPPSSPPVSTTSRHTNVQLSEKSGNALPERLTRDGMSRPPQGAKTLRLAPRAPRKMLLCKSLPSKPPNPVELDSAVGPRLGKLDVPYSRPPPQPPPEEEEDDYLSRFRRAQQERLQARMAGKKNKPVALDSEVSSSQPPEDADAGNQDGRPSDKVVHAQATNSIDTGRVISQSSKLATTGSLPADKSKRTSESAILPSHIENIPHHEAIALDIGRMDEQLLNTSLTSRTKAKTSLHASNVAKRTSENHMPYQAGLPSADAPDDRTIPAQPTKPLDIIGCDDIHNPSDPQATTNPTNRAFRRVHSENDAALPAEKQTSPPLIPAALAAAATKHPFQRSASAIVPHYKANKAPTPKSFNTNPQEPLKEAVAVKDTDLGPWSREALDLFDWRPPNRDGNLVVIG